MTSFDAVIIGAGIVGAACAAALAAEGLSVAIVDENSVAGGATAAGMGHIVVMDDSEAQFALTNRSRKLWNDLAHELPRVCEYEFCGTIWVAADADEMQDVHHKHEFYRSRGVKTEILDGGSLRKVEPNLRNDIAGGLLVEGDSVVYQLAATKYLIDKALRSNAMVMTRKRAVDISDAGVTLDGGETITCGNVVNAAGFAAAGLTPGLDIVKRKGHLVITERYPGFVGHQLVELGYLRSAHGRDSHSVAFNVQPRLTGQVLIGSSRQFGVDSVEVDYSIVRQMLERAFEFMPKLKDLSVVRIWTGFRPATPDNLPYIGKVPGRENVYVAAGHEGLGITTALGTAELLADEIMGRTSAIDRTPYSPSRKIVQH